MAIDAREMARRATGGGAKPEPSPTPWGGFPAPVAAPDAHAAVNTAAANDAGAALFALIAPQIRGFFADLDSERIERVIRETAERLTPKITVLETTPVVNADPIRVENPHPMLETVVWLARRRRTAMLIGPAGGGKTTAGELTGKLLGLPHYAMSLGPQTSKGDLTGYPLAQGGYQETLLTRAWRNGGVITLDEFDRVNGALVTTINAIAENGTKSLCIGGEMVPRHPDFVLILTANTWGYGGDAQYVGATRLDASTLDRVQRLTWDYDQEFERRQWGRCPLTLSWVEYVHRVRDTVFRLGIQAVVGPRAVLDGVSYLTGDDAKPWEEVADMAVWSRLGGVNSETAHKVRAAMGA
jgi:hypothetical protein